MMGVSHTISNTFVTTLKLERLTMTSANQTAISQNVAVVNSNNGIRNSYNQTKNVKSTGKVDFGIVYPTFEHMVADSNSILI